MKRDLRVCDLFNLSKKELLMAKELSEKLLDDAIYMKDELEQIRWKKRLHDIGKCIKKMNIEEEIKKLYKIVFGEKKNDR